LRHRGLLHQRLDFRSSEAFPIDSSGSGKRPIGALTAWQGLFERARLQAGERVLIHGGSGAVGVFAIQLARRTGAHVITTASSRNFDFLSQLGANEVIDYRLDRFEDRARDLDVVFDAVGGETLKRSWSLLKPQGRMVTIAADSEGTKDERIEKAFFIVEPNQKELTEISRLLTRVSFNALWTLWSHLPERPTPIAEPSRRDAAAGKWSSPSSRPLSYFAM
jgi:NADPH:quinone reductase-like Zn-dependent oxidoreductase